ncbi:hypothetical protein CEE45_10580 [Candidatus Heimdallarchaeota archaeon B3_Heim]|nr:MAG: hypothetical protein CEE45_10580 [Candidatus Heimdallarchaeota archaeon B3_Heim]
MKASPNIKDFKSNRSVYTDIETIEIVYAGIEEFGYKGFSAGVCGLLKMGASWRKQSDAYRTTLHETDTKLKTCEKNCSDLEEENRDLSKRFRQIE